MLYVAYLIDTNHRSAMIKSYVLAIRAVLKNLGVRLVKDNAVLASLLQACRLKNNQIQTRLPIRKGLMQILISSVDRLFQPQSSYILILYKALIASAYFGMFRVGKLMLSQHVVKACDMQIALNKQKMMFILRSSKTHNKGDKRQIIKIVGLENRQPNNPNRHCLFKLLWDYIKVCKT